MNFKKVILFIFAISTVLLPAEFYRLSDTDLYEAKQDSGSIWVANPIPDKSMGYKDTINIDLSYIFNVSEDVVVDVNNPVVFDTTILSASYVEIDSTIYLQLRTKEKYGHSYVSLTASTYNSSATDEFLVRVEDPDYLWNPLSGQYNITPENTLGSLGEWKAAAVFDLGSAQYLLNCIEFGYSLDGTADWEIVSFDGLPTDSIINGLSGTKAFKGGYSSFIENLNGSVTGQIAVMFTVDSNFMAMEPDGISDNTWVYSESTGWLQPEDDISPDYAGAWYIRLLLLDTSGIEETLTTEKTPYLLRNYPNPFNNETVIKWSMNKPGNAVINVYSSKGEFVKSIERRNYSSGIHSITFDSSGLNSGVYYYELLIDGKRKASDKMLYLK